jgi:hypothetical protein
MILIKTNKVLLVRDFLWRVYFFHLKYKMRLFTLAIHLIGTKNMAHELITGLILAVEKEIIIWLECFARRTHYGNLPNALQRM